MLESVRVPSSKQSCFSPVPSRESYGNKIFLSETVDSKVVPVWTDDMTPDITERHNSMKKEKSRRKVMIRQRSTVDDGINDFTDIAEMVNPTWTWGRPRKNDLCVRVDPFETSKLLRLSIIGERLQSKVELGVLQIPLGPALECCAQSLEDFEEDRGRLAPKGLPPAYVRWFPLMSPSESVPIEGDMGRSIREAQ